MGILKIIERRETGQGLVEYGLILALVSVVAVSAIGGVGDKVTSTFSSVSHTLDGGIYTEEEIDQLVTEERYIPISSADDLDNIRTNENCIFGLGTRWEGDYTSGLNGKYVQVANIDLGAGGDFEPIGSDLIKFTGAFDGGGYTISNLTVNHENYAGLFGYIEDSVIRNVRLINVDVSGNWSVGGLVGRQDSSSIIGSSITGVVSGTSNTVGGLVGFQYMNSKVDSSYSEVDVHGKAVIGGLVGLNYVDSSVLNSYAISSVEGDNEVGGLVGRSDQRSTVTSSYAAGLVTSSDLIGGLVGTSRQLSDVKDSYYDIDITLQTDNGKGIGKTTEAMKNHLTYKGWDFDTVWQIEKGQYPTLQ